MNCQKNVHLPISSKTLTDDVRRLVFYKRSNFAFVVAIHDPTPWVSVHCFLHESLQLQRWRFLPSRTPVQSVQGNIRHAKLLR